MIEQIVTRRVQTSSMIAKTLGKGTMPLLPSLFADVTMAFSKRMASRYKTVHYYAYAILKKQLYFKLVGVGNAAVNPQVFHRTDTMRGYEFPCMSITEPMIAARLLTAQDIMDVQAGIRLCKSLPCTDDACGRVHKRAVHVKQTVQNQSAV